jgi:hypothetical protein
MSSADIRGGAAQARLDAFDAVEVVDDAGVSLPPEEATSLRMAFAAGLVDGAAVSADPEATESAAAADDAAFHQLHADAMAQAHAMFERFGGAAAFAARIKSTDFCSDDADGDTPAATVVGDANVRDGATQDADCGTDLDGTMEEDDEGTGMEGAEYSRAYSDVGDDGEWVLERILSHRAGRNRGEPSFDCETALGARVREYQCKWRGYTEPTWETAATLDRLGCSDEVALYDYVARLREDFHHANTHTYSYRFQPGSTAPAPINATGAVPYRHCIHMPEMDEEAHALAQSQAALLRRCFPYSRKHIGAVVTAALNAAGRVATDVAFVAPPARVAAFFAEWGGNIQDVAPSVVFHGTRKHNVGGICSHGLVVPGTAGHTVTVQTGSGYGVGIYTAIDATTSLMYGNEFLFVCIGLIGPNFVTTRAGVNDGMPYNFVVFGNADHVLPLYLVRHVISSDVNSPPPLRMHDSAEVMLDLLGSSARSKAATRAARMAALQAAIDEQRADRELDARTDAVLHKHFRNTGPKMLRRARVEVRQLLQGQAQ